MMLLLQSLMVDMKPTTRTTDMLVRTIATASMETMTDTMMMVMAMDMLVTTMNTNVEYDGTWEI